MPLAKPQPAVIVRGGNNEARIRKAASRCICNAGLIFLQIPSPVLASTVGVLSGRVTDSATNQPLANVRVTAASPSGAYHATTDAHGFYSLTGVPADTYVVSFEEAGYQSTSIPGVTVFADQSQSLNETLSKSLRTIAVARARAAGSAFQPSQTVDTVSIGTQQITQFQGSTFNFDEVHLISSLPGAELDSSGYPVIHGGREYEEGFEFEGIPYTEAYTNQFTNSFSVNTQGLGSVQLTPGGGDITQTSGGFGALNVIAKRGTYPSYAQFGGSLGGPAYDHRFTFDYSFATPNGRFSNYASFAGDNQTFRFGNDKYPYAQIGRFFDRRMNADREFMDNFVFRFGSNNHESLQLFADIAQHDFYQGAGGVTGLCFASCDQIYTGTWGPGVFGLTPTEIQNMSTLYPGQNSVTETLAQAGNRAPGTYWQPNQAFKFEYTNNLNESTFFSLTGYSVNSVVTFDFPSPMGSFDGDSYLLQGGATTGVTLAFQKQLSEKHLLQAGADYARLHPIDSYLSDSFSFFGALLGLFNGFPEQLFLPAQFVPPSDTSCPYLGTPIGCSWAYQGPYANATQLSFPQFDQIANVNRYDSSFYLSDKWTPSDRLNLQLGARLDMASYGMPKPGIDPTYCTTTYLPITWVPPTTFDAADNWKCNAQATFSYPNNAIYPKVPEPLAGVSYRLGSNDAVRLTYRRAVQFVPIGDVAFGEVDPSAYLGPFGMIPAYEPFGAGTSSCGLAGTAQTTAAGQMAPPALAVPCRNFGEQLYWINQNFDGIAYQAARPTTSDNYEFTYQHQFAGNGLLGGMSVSISPWYRNQHDTIASEASPLIGANGQPEVVNGSILFGPPVLTNNGKEHASGVDFNLTREVPYGLSGQLTMTYINEFSSVIPLSTLEDFYPTIQPASIALGNVYRVGFLSPFQGTLALSYQTRTGWRFNPRYTWNIGYPTGQGLLTAAYVNGVAYNIPNTNAVASTAPAGPACFVDPQNPGSVFNPVEVGCRGNPEASSPGGKLTPPSSLVNLTVEYAAPNSRLAYGFDVENVFDQVYSGAVFSGRYQPIANGISGPLSGFSTNPFAYTSYPSAWPQYGSFIKSNGTYVAVPSNVGRSYFVYVKVRI